jgi:hypothetical protein
MATKHAPDSPYFRLARVITWASDAAFEHVKIARHRGEATDPEWGMGLWQTFQEAFPKLPNEDRGMTITAASEAYTAAVRNLTGLNGTGSWTESES